MERLGITFYVLRKQRGNLYLLLLLLHLLHNTSYVEGIKRGLKSHNWYQYRPIVFSISIVDIGRQYRSYR